MKYPIGFETLYLGDQANLEWESISRSGMVKLELITDTDFHVLIAENIPIENGSIPWTVGSYNGGVAAPGDNYKIRISIQGITGDESYTDTSNVNFSIKPAVAIQIGSPTGGENWPLGTQQEVNWTSNAPEGSNLRLYLWKGGNWWADLADGLPAVGTYNWQVGAAQAKAGDIVAGSDYRMVMEGPNGDWRTFSGYFSISGLPQKRLTVTFPNGNETVKIGSSYTVTWTSENIGASELINIEYTTDGQAWTALPQSVNDGQGPWSNVTGPASTTCKVRVSLANDPTVYDVSNQNFAIVSAPQTYTITVDVQSGHGWILPNWVTYKVYTVNSGSAFSVTLTPEDGYWGNYYEVGGPNFYQRYNYPWDDRITIANVDRNFTVAVYFTN